MRKLELSWYTLIAINKKIFMKILTNMNWLEKSGVALAVVIVAGLMYYTTSGSSAFTPPPGDSNKIYISTFGNDRNDGRTQDTAVRSFAKALEMRADTIVLVGETYVLPRRIEHLQSSEGLILDHNILVTSDQTSWEGGPSGGGGFTSILPDDTYGYLKLFKDFPSSVFFTSISVRFANSFYYSDGFINERIQGV